MTDRTDKEALALALEHITMLRGAMQQVASRCPSPQTRRAIILLVHASEDAANAPGRVELPVQEIPDTSGPSGPATASVPFVRGGT